MAAVDDKSYPGGPGGYQVGDVVTGAGTQPGTTPPMDEYPEGVPDFRDPAQNPNENYYDPNEDVDQYGYQTGINGEKNYDVNVGMTGGLMDTINAIGGSKYADRGYGVAPGSAVNRQVNQNELAQFQLGQMLDANGPLMQRAAASAQAKAGGRGLMNSSIAVGNAQGEMIDRAQPFALQDASWYGKTAADNMDATNRMAEANLNMRGRSMEAGAARDRQILQEQLSGYGDIRKAMINIEDREDTQAFKDEDREDTQEYNADQNQMNRDWTSNENMLTNSLAWAQTKLDAATRMGITREQAFADMYSAIMTNPNPKFTAAQREQAVRNMNATLNAKYGENSAGPYENSYDPATGQYDESLRPPPVDPEAAASTATASARGGDAGRERFFDPNNPSASNPGAQVWGSNMSPEYGAVTAGLPAV